MRSFVVGDTLIWIRTQDDDGWRISIDSQLRVGRGGIGYREVRMAVLQSTASVETLAWFEKRETFEHFVSSLKYPGFANLVGGEGLLGFRFGWTAP